MKILKEIQKIIKKHKRFVISTHVNPDPDALCSSLSLATFLESLGKQVEIVNEEDVPSRYCFLDKSHEIKTIKHQLKFIPEVFFILDCGELDRIGKVKSLVGKGLVVNIDHHVTNDCFGEINWVNTSSSSTAEMIYELLRFFKHRLDKSVAENLYIGMMTDTGSFRYENTTARTFEVAGDLVKQGINTNVIYQKIYERIPYKDLKGVAAIISSSQVLLNGKVFLIELKKYVIKNFSEKFDLRDAIFRQLRSIEGIELIAILTEVNQKQTRVNFRSNKFVDVAKLAACYGGGGHKRASGCTINFSLSKAKTILIKEIKKVL